MGGSIKTISQLTPEERQGFDQQVRRAQLRTSRLYTLIVMLVSLLFLFTDYQFLSEQFQEILSLRLGISGVGLLMLYSLKHMSPGNAFRLLAAGIILYNLQIVYIGIVAAETGLYTYQQGTILVIIYCCTLFQAPFMVTAVITVISWLTYCTGIILYSDTSPIVILNNTFLFGAATLMGLMAVMHRERYLIAYYLKSTELSRQKQHASHQAMTDALTMLPNRYALMRELEGYHGEVPADMLVMMLDVDNFKKLNDEYGHHIGDEALTAVASALAQVAEEEQAFLARYGGEEFIILADNIGATKAKKVADRALTGVRNITRETLPSMTISAGAYLTRESDTSISECIERADQALLQAKQQGKDRVVFG